MSGLLKFAFGLFALMVMLAIPVVREVTLAILVFSVTWVVTVHLWAICWAIIGRLLHVAGLIEEV